MGHGALKQTMTRLALMDTKREKRMNMDTTSVVQQIMNLHEERNRLGNKPDFGVGFWLGGKSRSQLSYDNATNLQRVASEHPDAVAYIVVNNPRNYSEDELISIIRYTSAHWGSVARKDVGTAMISLCDTLRTNRDKLPEIVAYHLDWCERVHGY